MHTSQCLLLFSLFPPGSPFLAPPGNFRSLQIDSRKLKQGRPAHPCKVLAIRRATVWLAAGKSPFADEASVPPVSSREYYDEHRNIAHTGDGGGRERERGREVKEDGNSWLEINYMKCLGRGGYGDVYEATIRKGPLTGQRAVAKRALKRQQGKIKWEARGWESMSVTTSNTEDMSWTTYYNLKTNISQPPPSLSHTQSWSQAGLGAPIWKGLATLLVVDATTSISTTTSYYSSSTVETSTGGGGGGGEGTTDGGYGEAVEYLEVEDYVNRLIASNCPQIAAPYVGDVFADDGTRWLVWLFETGSRTLSDLISQAHKENSIKCLAHALGATATTLQHTALPLQLHCNTLQHTATHCNTLQHTATYCNATASSASRTSEVWRTSFHISMSHVIYDSCRIGSNI